MFIRVVVTTTTNARTVASQVCAIWQVSNVTILFDIKIDTLLLSQIYFYLFVSLFYKKVPFEVRHYIIEGAI